MANPPITMKNSSSQTQTRGKAFSTTAFVQSQSRREYKELVNGRSVCSSSSVSEYHGRSLPHSTAKSHIVGKTTSLKRITSIESSGKPCDDNNDSPANVLRQGSIMRNKSSAIITAKNNKKEMMRHSRSVVSTSLSENQVVVVVQEEEEEGGREKGVGGTHAVKLPLPCVNDQYGSVPLCSKLAHESKSNSKTQSYNSHRNNKTSSSSSSSATATTTTKTYSNNNNYQRAQMSVTNSPDKSSVSIQKLSVVSKRNEAVSVLSTNNDKTRMLKRQFAVRVNSNESEQSDSHSLNKQLHCKIKGKQPAKNNISLRKMAKQTESNNNIVDRNCCNNILASTNVKTNTRKRPICNKSPTMSPSPLSLSRPIIQKTSVHLTATKNQPSNKQQSSFTHKTRSNNITVSPQPIKTKDFTAKLDISIAKGRESALTSSSVVNVKRKAENKTRKMTASTSSSSSSTVRKKGLKILKPMESYMQICEGTELELSVHIEGAKEVVWVKDDTIIQHLPPDFVYAKETIVNSSGEIYTLKIADTFIEDSGIYICEAYGVEKDDDVISWCRVDVIAMEENGVGRLSVADEAITPQFKAPCLPLVNSEALVVCQELALDLSAQDLSECKDIEPTVQVQVKTPSLPIDNSEALTVCQEQLYDTIAQDVSEEQCREFEQSVQVQIAPISPLTFHPNKDFDVVPHSCNDVHDDSSSNSRQLTTTIKSQESAPSAKDPNEDASLLLGESDVITVAQEACLAQEIAIAGKQEECIPLERNQILSISPAQAPKIVMGPTNLIALFGETIHLRVKMHCFDMSNTTVTWSKFHNGSYKVIVDNAEPYKDDITGNVKISTNNEITTLTLGKISYDDSGKYLVNIANGAGDDSHVCILTVEGPPVPPSSPPDVKYNIVTNTILVAWAGSPYDGGSAVTGYYVEVSIKSSTSSKNNQNDTWSLLTPQSGNWLCYTVAEPTPNASYKFRIRAVNAYGQGEPSMSSEDLFISHNSDSNSSYRSGSRQSSLQNYCSEVDDEDRSESDVTFREYTNVDLKCGAFLDYYEKHEELGKGRFGVVFRVVQKLNGESYAGKFIKCIKAKDKERVHLEFNIMNDLKYHPKLLCLTDGFEMSREIVIITERINGGELFERVVADDFTLTEHDCIDFLRQISAGVEYIHSKNIMHLDLKPENILCTTKSCNLIKIIDFGLAQYYNPEDPIRVLFGTAEFVSPEIINYDTICPSADMWSIGVITYILLSGLSPFMGDNDNETFSNITIGEFDFDDDSFENVSEDAKDFISSLIVKRKEKRLSAKECLEHKWLIQCSDVERKDIIIPTDKLKRFLVRRKWQKTGNAIRALGRITTLYSSRRSSSASSTTSSPSYSPLMRSFSTQESTDNDSVFLNNFHPAVSPLSVSLGKDKRISPICEGTVTKYNGINDSSNDTLDESVNSNKSKYNESCRSDSGICDAVGP